MTQDYDDRLRQHLERFMKRRKLRPSTWSTAAGRSQNALAQFLNAPRRGESQTMTTLFLSQLASAASVDPSDLLPTLDRRLERITVTGAVQTGVWSNSADLPAEDQFTVTMMRDPRYSRLRRFGVLVRDDAMNLVYPAGTVLVCVDFRELDRGPRNRERVIVHRFDDRGRIEATVRQLVLEEGLAYLWPRSSRPQFQQPMPLPAVPHELAEAGQAAFDPGETEQAVAPGLADYRSEELEIVARVTGYYRPE